MPFFQTKKKKIKLTTKSNTKTKGGTATDTGSRPNTLLLSERCSYNRSVPSSHQLCSGGRSSSDRWRSSVCYVGQTWRVHGAGGISLIQGSTLWHRTLYLWALLADTDGTLLSSVKTLLAHTGTILVDNILMDWLLIERYCWAVSWNDRWGFNQSFSSHTNSLWLSHTQPPRAERGARNTAINTYTKVFWLHYYVS